MHVAPTFEGVLLLLTQAQRSDPGSPANQEILNTLQAKPLTICFPCLSACLLTLFPPPAPPTVSFRLLPLPLKLPALITYDMVCCSYLCTYLLP